VLLLVSDRLELAPGKTAGKCANKLFFSGGGQLIVSALIIAQFCKFLIGVLVLLFLALSACH